jgi:hypothetical protein
VTGFEEGLLVGSDVGVQESRPAPAVVPTGHCQIRLVVALVYVTASLLQWHCEIGNG